MDFHSLRPPPPVNLLNSGVPIPLATNGIPVPPPLFSYPPPFPPPTLPPYPPPYHPVPLNVHQLPPPTNFPPPYQNWHHQLPYPQQQPPPLLQMPPQYPLVQQNMYNQQSERRMPAPQWSRDKHHTSESRGSSSRLRNSTLSSSRDRPSRSLTKPLREQRSYRRPEVESDLYNQSKLEDLVQLTPEEIIEQEKKTWTRCAPADLYYERDLNNLLVMKGTAKLASVVKEFQEQLLERSRRALEAQPKFEAAPRRERRHNHRHCGSSCKDSASGHRRNHNAAKAGADSDDSLTSESDEDEDEDEVDLALQELERKKRHPARLHAELWYNDAGEMNDGPLCRCSHKAKRTGIRHGIYSGETPSRICQLDSNNADLLHHYRVTISPPTNFLLKRPTIIRHDEHEFIFEGFSLFSHYRLDKVPTCKVIRFNIEYTIVYIEEKFPDNFTVQELELFSRYLFRELLELVDLDLHAAGDTQGCPQFHVMPRFVRDLPDNGKEVCSKLPFHLSTVPYGR